MTNLSFYPGDEDEDKKGAGLAADESTDEASDDSTDEPEVAAGEDEDDLLDDGIVEGEEIE